MKQKIIRQTFNLFEEEKIEETNVTKNKYTSKIDIPQYQITGEMPNLIDLVNQNKYYELRRKILNNNHITQEQKDFLLLAATRHLQFNYGKIAEYYAHQDKEMQQLMEDSALVIIDYDDAIRNGYAQLAKGIEEMIYDDGEI